MSSTGRKILKFWRGWCDTHGEYKTRIAFVVDRVVRVPNYHPPFCASCAREYVERNR